MTTYGTFDPPLARGADIELAVADERNRQKLYERLRSSTPAMVDVPKIEALVEASIALVREIPAYLDSDWRLDDWWNDEPTARHFLDAVSALGQDGGQ